MDQSFEHQAGPSKGRRAGQFGQAAVDQGFGGHARLLGRAGKGGFGAQVSGVDLTREEDFAGIHQAFLDHGIVCIRETPGVLIQVKRIAETARLV